MTEHPDWEAGAREAQRRDFERDIIARDREDEYAEAVKRATTEQGLDPVIAALSAVNIKCGLDQTGGMTMAVTVPAKYGTWAINQHMPGTEHRPPSYNLAFYTGDDWNEGGADPLHIGQMLLPTLVENIATADQQPWQPGQVVEAGGDAIVTWVASAPRTGFWWVGYMRDGVKYAGIHIDKDGYDQKGRWAMEAKA